jgi:hypothetical protein
MTLTYSQREFTGQLSSYAAEGAEYALCALHLRIMTKKGISFDRWLVWLAIDAQYAAVLRECIFYHHQQEGLRSRYGRDAT